MEYNPSIQTYNEKPTPEAVKAATMVTRFMYWMMNDSCLEFFNNAFGPVLGSHLWSRVCNDRKEQGSFYGDLHFWTTLTDWNREKLMHYILKTGYKG